MDILRNEFIVNLPIDKTWEVLTDVERIAPCLPGAELQEIEGDVFRGIVKVKLGAISASFKGQASFVERDDINHRAVLSAAGSDTTGKGRAEAKITARVESVTADTTRCFVETDMRISGKIAQFGRGIMADVSKKLMDQFANNLNTMLDENPDAIQTTPLPIAPSGPALTQPTVRKIEGATAEPLSLGNVAGVAVLKRVLPLVVGLAIVVAILWKALV